MSKKKKQIVPQSSTKTPKDISLGFDMKSYQGGDVGKPVSVYENRFTSNGDVKGYNIDTILKNKQDNIYKIFELCNYYVDADPIYGNAIKKILTPFSLSGWKLMGASEKIKQKYKDYFESIGIFDLLRDVFYDLNLYENCYIYDRGNYFDVFPPHRIRISSIGINGEPVLEYKISEFNNKNYTIAKEGFIDTLLKSYEGYPPEIIQGIKDGNLWIQLNPENTYALQGVKSRWEKYCVPFISSCLRSFSKKNLIGEFENSQLSVGMKSFLHVKVGSEKFMPSPSPDIMKEIGGIFKNAINGFPLAITSYVVDANWITVDTKNMFDKAKYDEVNTSILSSCGLSAIIVTGDSSSSNFASATVNVSVAEKKISANQKNVAEFLKKIMKKRAIEWRIADSKVPSFVFDKVSIQDDKAMREEISALFTLGLVSYKTAIESMGQDYDQEKERKTKEKADGDKEIFEVPPSFNNQSGKDDKGGAPEKPGADKSKSATGKQPKPSTS
jgi:hypothetical protein